MKRLLTALFILAPALLHAQSAAAPAEVAPIPASGGFFGLSVPDLEASARWYEEKLGLKRVLAAGRYERVAGVIVLEGGGLMVELIQHDDAVRPASAELAQGFFKAGVYVNDFDATVATLRARGIPIAMGPYPARATQRANVAIRDNAGNLLFFIGGYAPR
jgi:catechol 2,3-dioxygenase-like lactoylglutathione lyase family enzyme